MKIQVYLNFPGTCEEAMTFYEKLLGGDSLEMWRFRGSPAEQFAPDESWLDKVMHATLIVGDQVLMGSDAAPQQFKTPQGYHVSLALKDKAEAERVFTALSEGGMVTMPLDQTFWTDAFGMCTDRFGINWMIGIEDV